MIRRNGILWYAVALHLYWGIMLILFEPATYVTALADLPAWFAGSRYWAGISLILASVLATWGALNTKLSVGMRGLVMILPQQILLMISAGTAVEAIAQSAFADGEIRPRSFIAADQFPAVLAASVHTFAVWDYLVEETKALVRKNRRS